MIVIRSSSEPVVINHSPWLTLPGPAAAFIDPFVAMTTGGPKVQRNRQRYFNPVTGLSRHAATNYQRQMSRPSHAISYRST